MGFEVDTGVTRASKGLCNKEKAEELIKGARTWMSKNKSLRTRVDFYEALVRLGQFKDKDLKTKAEIEKAAKELAGLVSKGKIVPLFSCANDLSWEFSPRNLRGAFRDLAVKYKIKVGSHHGTTETSKTAKKPQENYFREMVMTDIPEVDVKLREEFSTSSPVKAK